MSGADEDITALVARGAELVYHDVYRGLWWNKSRNRVYGTTITLSQAEGAVLIAFLAFYVGLAGKGCWKVMRYIVHRYFSSNQTPDGVYNQRQAILRNSTSGFAAAIDLFEATIIWRWKNGRKSTSRLLPITGLSLLFSLVFAAAGIMSSRVTSLQNSEVMLTGNMCGMRGESFEDGSEAHDFATTLLWTFATMQYMEYSSYALQCYRNVPTSPKCGTFRQQNLPFTKSFNATCPYGKELCLQQSGNVAFDTGYLESDKHLGINVNPRFLIRHTRECAPLLTEGYTKVVNETEDDSKLVIEYHYAENGTSTQPTYKIPLNQTNLNRPYKVSAESFDRKRNMLPSRNQPNSVLNLIFLEAPDVRYPTNVSDPWFKASTKPEGDQFYYSDNPAGVVACTSRFFICNPLLPHDKRCLNVFDDNWEAKVSSLSVQSNKTNSDYFVEHLATLWPNLDDTLAVFGALRQFQPDLMHYGIMLVDPSDFYDKNGKSPVLLADYTTKLALQSQALSPTQWQREMEFAFQVGLAAMQSAVVETAGGMKMWEYQHFDACKARPLACMASCRAQIIKSPQHSSFSALGVFIIVALGSFLILVGNFVEWIAAHFSNSSTYAVLEWNATSTLQLQRLAHEGFGFGTWSRANDAVPTTHSDDVLGVLDASNPKHPVLVHPSSLNPTSVAYIPKMDNPQQAGFTTATDTTNRQVLEQTSDRDSFIARGNVDNGRLGGESPISAIAEKHHLEGDVKKG